MGCSKLNRAVFLTDPSHTIKAIVVSLVLKLVLVITIISFISVVTVGTIIFKSSIHLSVILSLSSNILLWYGYLISTVLFIPALVIVYSMLATKRISWWYAHIASIILLMIVTICGFYISVALYNLVALDKSLHTYEVSGAMQNDTTRLLAEQYIRTRF